MIYFIFAYQFFFIGLTKPNDTIQGQTRHETKQECEQAMDQFRKDYRYYFKDVNLLYYSVGCSEVFLREGVTIQK